MNLIKIGNIIINLSLLIDAEFAPARPENDVALEPARSAKITLRFSAPQSDAHADDHGEFTGATEASPYERRLYGEDAENCWRELCLRDTRAPKENR